MPTQEQIKEQEEIDAENNPQASNANRANVQAQDAAKSGEVKISRTDVSGELNSLYSDYNNIISAIKNFQTKQSTLQGKIAQAGTQIDADTRAEVNDVQAAVDRLVPLTTAEFKQRRYQ